ncbi:hypothetical protein PAEPH01_0393 [Pancytospora epiphaga]|nr:hypothetical protein PAEPH01_0393 [Pancytospora epiphaga]
MLVFKQYKIVYIVSYMSTVITSSNISNCHDLKSRLKRKSEDNSSEVCQTKRFSFSTTNFVENLPVKPSVSKKENNHIVEEHIKVKTMSVVSPLGTVIHKGINTDDEEDKNEVRIITEFAPKMIRNEKSLMPSNFHFYRDIPNHLKDEERGLLNSQLEAIDRKFQAISNFEQNLVRQRPYVISVYSYSNPMFLYFFLHFPLSIFTLDSIRMRFGSGLLNFLSIDQVIRVLIALLNKDLKLTKAERQELVEMIFGHIDFSLKMRFNNNQIVSIVTALLSSDVPHCFEQVFLTWKMWKVFTTEEQEKMLEDVIGDNNQVDEMKYKKETLVMLYLFILNRDEVNSSKCEVFKECIIEVYGITYIFNDYEFLTPSRYIKRNLLISDRLDTSLLDLPRVLRNLDDFNLTKFKELTRLCICTVNGRLRSTYYGKRYKIHIFYALTKFTREITENNNEGFAGVYDKVYFKPMYIGSVFRKWIRVSKSDTFSVNQRDVNEFRNAYCAMRQILQSEEYNFVDFFRLFYTMDTRVPSDKLFALVLFSLTRESILRDADKSPVWTDHMKNRNVKNHRFAYIENIYMYNANPGSKLLKSYSPCSYVRKITDIFLSLINTNEGLYREHCLYQQLLFYPKFDICNNSMMKSYILGLSKAGQLDNKERRMQIARDLIFNKFYCKLAMKLPSKLIKAEGTLKEFRKSLEEECECYKNATDIENERKLFKTY